MYNICMYIILLHYYYKIIIINLTSIVFSKCFLLSTLERTPPILKYLGLLWLIVLARTSPKRGALCKIMKMSESTVFTRILAIVQPPCK